MEKGYLSAEAGRLAGGIPQRTVQSWTEKGLISPDISGTTGTGDRRRYSEANIKELAEYRMFLQAQKQLRREFESKMIRKKTGKLRL